jgi:hypothetical protein
MGFWEPIKSMAGRGVAGVKVLFSRLSGIFRRRKMLILLGLTLVMLLCLMAILLVMNPKPGGIAGGAPDLGETFRPRSVPPEELFLPGEPDFLPRFRLERERRDFWTAEDARPFWTDLPEEGSEIFTDMVESVIDGLMERVP